MATLSHTHNDHTPLNLQHQGNCPCERFTSAGFEPLNGCSFDVKRLLRQRDGTLRKGL
jgi:hypothetical protein